MIFQVVDNFSSTLIGDAAERCQTINATHMQMCRFSGKDDDGYRKVCGELLQVVTAIERAKKMSKFLYKTKTHRDDMTNVALRFRGGRFE